MENNMADSAAKEWYNQLTKMFPDPRLTFMNYGYFGDETSFDWLKEEDFDQRYSINLVHCLVDGVDLTGKSVLEIGSGRGGNCSYLARYTKAKKIVGLDFCESHIEFSNNVHKFDNVLFQEGDAQALPFDNEAFDVILNIESSHGYPDLQKFASEVDRVLKKGGVFCYTDIMLETQNSEKLMDQKVGFEFFKPEKEYEDMIQKSGLSVKKYVDITPGVVKSLESDKGNLKSLMKKQINEKQQEGDAELPELVTQFIETMFHFVEVSGLSAFKNGDLFYKYWHLFKN